MPVVIQEFEITPGAYPEPAAAPVAAPAAADQASGARVPVSSPAQTQRLLDEARERALRVFAH